MHVMIGPPPKSGKKDGTPTPRQMAMRALIRAIEDKDYPRASSILDDYLDIYTAEKKRDRDED